MDKAAAELAGAITEALAGDRFAEAAQLSRALVALDTYRQRFVDPAPTLVERLAVRLGPAPGRRPAAALELEGLADHPQAAELIAAAKRHPARSRSRAHAVEVLEETRLLALLRLRDHLDQVPAGALSQVLAALEKSAAALGAKKPYTAITINRIQAAPPGPPALHVVGDGSSKPGG